MTSFLHSQLTKEATTTSLLQALKFVGLGVVWIVLSDLALFLTQPSIASHFPIFHIEVLKGILFVLVMGIFFFVMQRKNERATKELVDLDLFKRNSQSMMIYDLETMVFLDVNDAAVNTYGYSREEFMRMKICDLRPTEDLPALKKAVEQLQNGYRLIGNSTHIHKNKSVIHTELSVCSIVYKTVHAGLIIANDISNQVKAEHALIEATRMHEKQMNDRLYEVALFNKELQVRIREVNANNDDLIDVNKLLQNANRNVVARYEAKIQRMQEIVNRWMENAADIFWTIDLNDHTNTFISRGALTFFNCSRKAILDRPNLWELFVHPDDKTRVKDELLQLNTIDQVNIQYAHSDGRTMVSQTIELIRDEDEKVEKIVCRVAVVSTNATSVKEEFKISSRDLLYH